MQHQAQANRNKLALLERKQHIRLAKLAADSAAKMPDVNHPMPAAKTEKELAEAKDERCNAERSTSCFKKEAGEHRALSSCHLWPTHYF